ncbi:hypothetical protein [Mesorhizobium sp.]|uniref:hypothetical protein n=1 Tax=Mesorhizobium sp. TaxID=1871066 RepID=UPI000FEA4CCB|nr:hypothetical protein [Mesorhizobium sp.]RWJ05744.1 MAG: hypothetical protein EOR23_07875 [Mesorhizobium sp.]
MIASAMPPRPESAVNSLVGKRAVKKQQMRRSLPSDQMLIKVRTADLSGELAGLRASFRQPDPNVPPLFKPKPHFCTLPSPNGPAGYNAWPPSEHVDC